LNFELLQTSITVNFEAIPNMTDAARWKATVYVGGLAPEVTSGVLQAAFLPFGEIADISTP
jgi:RNA recognition motif-containing protein